MLRGFHGSFIESPCEFTLYGHKDDVLDLADALDNNVGMLDFPLYTENVTSYPFVEVLTELRVEVAGESDLLIKQTGTTLSISGARENVGALAKDVRDVAHRTHESPVGNVIIEPRTEPYMHVDCGFLCIEVYDPAHEPGDFLKK